MENLSDTHELELYAGSSAENYIVHYIECRKTASMGGSQEYIFNSFRICHVISGKADWQIDDRTYTIDQNDIVILNNIVSRSLKTIYPEEELVLDIYEFSPAALSHMSTHLTFFYTPSRYVIPSDESAPICLVLAKLKKELFENKLMRNEMAELLLEEALLESVRVLGQPDEHTEYASHTRYLICESAVYICNNLTECLLIEELAKRFNMSRGYFCTTFKKTIGVTPMQYIRSCRIQKALQLLHKPQYTVSRVAYESGFSSLSAFYKSFSLVMGTSPGQYMAQERKQNM